MTHLPLIGEGIKGGDIVHHAVAPHLIQNLARDRVLQVALPEVENPVKAAGSVAACCQPGVIHILLLLNLLSTQPASCSEAVLHLVSVVKLLITPDNRYPQ